MTVVTHAITIRLPWAAAVRAGRKNVENRARPIADRHVGTRVGIHAGAGWSADGADDSRIRSWWLGAHRVDRELERADFADLFRKVVAVVRIHGCHQAYQKSTYVTCCQPWGDRKYLGRPAWHIELADMVWLAEPVGPVRGSLSVPWALPDRVAAAVTERYLAAP